MNAMGVMMDDDDDDDAMLDYDYDVEKDLAKVTKTVKKILSSIQTNASAIRGRWKMRSAEATYQTSKSAHGRLIKPPSTGGGIISQDLLHGSALLKRWRALSSLSPSSSIRSIKDSIEKFYRCTFEPMTCKVLAFSFAFLSLAIILAESTI